jgi:hypothetical protein
MTRSGPGILTLKTTPRKRCDGSREILAIALAVLPEGWKSKLFNQFPRGLHRRPIRTEKEY